MESSQTNNLSTNKKISAPVENDSVNKQYIILNNSVEENESDCGRNICFEFLSFLKTLTIEPAFFLFLFACMMHLSCLSNLMMDKGCRHFFNYSEEVCTNLGGHEVEKENVEKLANNYIFYLNTLSFVATCMMIFIAPWSEKHGRKLPLALVCGGGAITNAGIVMCIFYYESSLNYLILCRLATEIFGGFICFVTITYSHAAEVSTVKNRTLKYTTIEIAFSLGLCVGGLAGGMILRYFGYIYVYMSSSILCFLSAAWILTVVEETAGPGVNASWPVKAKNFFRLDSLSRSWKATVKPRENKKRLMIWMYLLSICIVVLTYAMFKSLDYLYAHHIYDWDPAQYNIVMTSFSLCSFATIMMVSPIFLKVLKLSDPVLGILGCLSLMSKYGFIAFASYDVFIFYTGNVAGFLSSFSTLSIRTGLSKIINKEDLALVFSFLAICQAILPLFGTALSTVIFNATINVVPSVVYLFSAVILVVPFGTFMWVLKKMRSGRYAMISANNCPEI